MTGDTIAAAATPAGRGGVAIVRISGTNVPDIGRALLGALPAPRYATFARWTDASGDALDTGLALYFPAPHSFTGEDVLELHGHGGTVIVEALLEHLAQLGARRALPGEFSQRAYLNDKLDLAQAEAIADLIDAGSRAAARAALRSLQGEFSAKVSALREALITLRVQVEAGIDFPEEHLDLAAHTALRTRADLLRADLQQLLTAAAQGRVLAQGLTVVIAGRPNAGKSTLLNRLAGFDAAIVTPIAGTTRDLLREQVTIRGIPFELIDTAGLRAVTGDAIEEEGMRRARDAITRADHVLFVVDAVDDPRASSLEAERESLPADVPVTVVMNKVDLIASKGKAVNQGTANAVGQVTNQLAVSAATGTGLEQLRAHLAGLAGPAEAVGGAFSARARHVEALRRASAYLDQARAHLVRPDPELAAEELRSAQQSLGEVVGDLTSDDLLGEIFSRFCIGK
ncbi:MAG: tRNA uridine-5-carboxymethylaminomethyl(34) synthesis GTPase MnmE [Pseudomonadota bacterium]